MFSNKKYRVLAGAMIAAVAAYGCGDPVGGQPDSSPTSSSEEAIGAADGEATPEGDDKASDTPSVADAVTCSPLTEELGWMSDDGLPETAYRDEDSFGCTWRLQDAVIAVDFQPDSAPPDVEGPGVASDHGYTSWFDGTPDEYTVTTMSESGARADLYVLPAEAISVPVPHGAQWSLEFLHFVLTGQTYTGQVGTPNFGDDSAPLMQVDLDWLDPHDAEPSTEQLATVDLVRDGCHSELQQHFAVMLGATIGGALALTNDEVNGCQYMTPAGDTLITVSRSSVRDFATLDEAASYWSRIGWELTSGTDRVIVLDDKSDHGGVRGFFIDPTPMGQSPWREVQVHADSKSAAEDHANTVIDLLLSARS